MVSSRPRAFITCSSRARPVVGALIDEIEHRLLDLGWRTRVSFRAPVAADLALRRRLRATSQQEASRATCIIHVPAPASLAGRQLHRELHHGVKAGRPVLILRARTFREENDIGQPTDERLEAILHATAGIVVHELDGLEDALSDCLPVARRPAPQEQ